MLHFVTSYMYMKQNKSFKLLNMRRMDWKTSLTVIDFLLSNMETFSGLNSTFLDLSLSGGIMPVIKKLHIGE